jgi:hypothetical protein
MKWKSLILILGLLLSAVMVSMPTKVLSTSTNEFSIDGSPIAAHVGSEVVVSVKLDEVSDLNAWEFVLRWDKDVLTYTNVTWTWPTDIDIMDYYLSTVGNELRVFGGYSNPEYTDSGTDVIIANIIFNVVAGGTTGLNFTEHHLWTVDAEEMDSTAVDGELYTEEPYVDFFWTPSSPRANETVTFNASACYSPEGPEITYEWYIDDVPAGTEVTTTASFSTYSKTAHNITLVVTDEDGDSFTLQKDLLIDRDLAIFSIWPSPEDYMGSIVWNIPAGKYVIIMVRTANVGTITEYTNNAMGDFPSTTTLSLYLKHSDGTEEKLGSVAGGRLRRYRYAENASYWYYEYDWAPLVGVYNWFFWDTSGYAPENGLMLKANLTGLAGETDLSNNELTFGPFNLTAGYERDLRIEGIFTYDDVGYIQPYPPFPGTTFKYFYGPYTPGEIATVTVAFSNVGNYNEMFTYHVYAGSWDNEIWSETVTLLAGEYKEFTFEWNTTGYYGTYTLWVTVDPIEGTAVGDFNYDGSVDSSDLGMLGVAWGASGVDSNWNPICDLNLDGTIDSSDLSVLGAHWGEFGVEPTRWAVWDNNIYEMYAAYSIMFPFAYDDWGIYETFP